MKLATGRGFWHRWTVVDRWLYLVMAALVWSAWPSSAYAQGLGSFVSPGPLSSPHADLDSLSTCTSCHELGGGPSERLCLDCHDEVKVQVDNNRGFHKDKGENCQECHPEHRGRDFDILGLEKDDFDHDATGFPLRGAHRRADCEECHTEEGTFTGLDSACVSCHEDPHNSSKSKRPLLKDKDCSVCHGDDSWEALPLPPAIFDHTDKAYVDYVLEHDHVDVPCIDCHEDWLFVPIESELCIDCHRDPHRANFGKRACEDCHPSPKGWKVPRFDHNLTPYKLEGLHATVPSCTDCHGLHKTDPLAYEVCSDCHGRPHDRQFEPKQCHDCHTVFIEDFLLPEFDHDITDFPLEGKHAEGPTCEDCHGEGDDAVYVNLAHDDCDACHTDTHNGKYEPTDCDVCHDPVGFEVDAFDHDATAFPRTGKHQEVECAECHIEGSWNGIEFASCDDCHSDTNPHRNVVSRDQCEDCHVTEGFDVMVYDHGGVTGFSLDPQHTDQKCTACHQALFHFAGLNDSCTNCHLPDRPAGHYDGDCVGCHQAADWFPGGLGDNDHAITGFALEGMHAALPCESCHPEGRARGEAVPACASCHGGDDIHKHMLGNQCDDCHTDTSWFKTRWRHHQTGWPLRGSHRLAACVDCHAVGYIGTPTDCWRCHEADAPLTIRAHLSPAFVNCDTCHREYTWLLPATSRGL